MSKLCLGTMTFGYQCNEEQSVSILNAAKDHGFTFIDTADVYADGDAEGLLGELIEEFEVRDEVVLATHSDQALRLLADSPTSH